MKKVYICSPYRGNIEANTANARAYCREAIMRGYNPIAPHLYYPQFLNEDAPIERQFGLFCGLYLLRECHEMWVYGDPREATEGMRAEINEAAGLGIEIKYKDVAIGIDLGHGDHSDSSRFAAEYAAFREYGPVASYLNCMKKNEHGEENNETAP